jgi:lysophospholipase L1-like esterase
MHRESIVFIARHDRAAEGCLLFAPDDILAVTSAAADVTYREGADYLVDRRAGRLVRAAGSRMPEIRPDSIGTLLHDRVVAVTYNHSGDSSRHSRAAGTHARDRATEAREPVTICLTGDSISAGYDVSGFHRVPPYQPAFGELVAIALEQQYGAPVRLHNLATAGWTAADAAWDTARIAAQEPDLVIIAFGMNDAGYADAGEFAGNVSSVMHRVRADVADVEFVIVSPMLPTPECSWIIPARFAEYRAALAELTGEGVALADVTGLWTELVARKNPYDLSETA